MAAPPDKAPDFALVHAPLALWWAAMMVQVYCALARAPHHLAFTLGVVGSVAMGVVLIPIVREALRALSKRRTRKMRELVSVQMVVSLLALACWITSLWVRPSPNEMSLISWLAAIAGTLYVGNLFVVGSLIAIEARRP